MLQQIPLSVQPEQIRMSFQEKYVLSHGDLLLGSTLASTYPGEELYHCDDNFYTVSDCIHELFQAKQLHQITRLLFIIFCPVRIPRRVIPNVFFSHLTWRRLNLKNVSFLAVLPSRYYFWIQVGRRWYILWRWFMTLVILLSVPLELRPRDNIRRPGHPIAAPNTHLPYASSAKEVTTLFTSDFYCRFCIINCINLFQVFSLI